MGRTRRYRQHHQPTVVLTELGRTAWDNPNGERPQSRHPYGRSALPEEIAAAAVFPASDAATMTNGADRPPTAANHRSTIECSQRTLPGRL